MHYEFGVIDVLALIAFALLAIFFFVGRHEKKKALEWLPCFKVDGGSTSRELRDAMKHRKNLDVTMYQANLDLELLILMHLVDTENVEYGRQIDVEAPGKVTRYHLTPAGVKRREEQLAKAACA